MASPVITLVLTAAILALALSLFWPNGGLVRRWRRARQVDERVLVEDAIKHIHACESGQREPTIDSLAGVMGVTTDAAAQLLGQLSDRGMVQLAGDRFRLTANGRDYALQIVRAHRLWERYLADETGFAEAEWHALADRQEHALSVEEADALAARLGHPTHDPHGDPIPTAAGELVPHGGQPLTMMAVDTPLRIVHLEDEPESILAQLVAEGLRPGMTGRTTEISAQRIRLWADGDEHVLAPVLAANVYAVPLPEAEFEMVETARLADLEPGEKGTVIRISPACRGAERRRLMDLGILPGTLITAEFKSPAGDPVAYCIRGAVIALRRNQARWIHVTRAEEASP